MICPATKSLPSNIPNSEPAPPSWASCYWPSMKGRQILVLLEGRCRVQGAGWLGVNALGGPKEQVLMDYRDGPHCGTMGNPWEDRGGNTGLPLLLRAITPSTCTYI